jgi:hypothetical protein
MLSWNKVEAKHLVPGMERLRIAKGRDPSLPSVGQDDMFQKLSESAIYNLTPCLTYDH